MRPDQQPWPIRAVSALLIWSQLGLGLPAFAATPAVTNVTAQAQSNVPVPLQPPKVKPNRKLPKGVGPSVKPAFSAKPTDQEIMHRITFPVPLVPDGKTTTEENQALAAALLKFYDRTSFEDVTALTAFLDQFNRPASSWGWR